RTASSPRISPPRRARKRGSPTSRRSSSSMRRASRSRTSSTSNGAIDPLAEALLEHAIGGADALVGSAEGPAGLRFRSPGEDVEVHPGAGVLDEALEEQRGGDRAGLPSVRHMVDVSNLG